MDIWCKILKALHALALSVPNCGPAGEAIIAVRYLPVSHSDEHGEELHAPIHALFG